MAGRAPRDTGRDESVRGDEHGLGAGAGESVTGGNGAGRTSGRRAARGAAGAGSGGDTPTGATSAPAPDGTRGGAPEAAADPPDSGADTPDDGDSARPKTGFGLWPLIRRHPTFSVIIVMGALLRLTAMAGFRPVMFFNDSFDYLHVAMEPYPHPLRPDGYGFLLILLKPFHSFALVAGVQHLMGLAMGVMIYALLHRRFRLPGWGAALAAAPVLLDAYQIQLEHLLLSDTLFAFLVMSAVTLLLWRDRPSWKIAAAVGLIVGFSWLTRTVGMPVLIGVLTYMLIRRSGWKIMAVTAVACMLPVLSYMSWYKAETGKFAMTESTGIFLYARVYKFADCHEIPDLPVRQYPLCTEPENRLPKSQDGIWNSASPLNRYPGQRFSPENNELANDYAKRAITNQPVDYAKVVLGDFFRVFQWERTVFPDPATYGQYEFWSDRDGNPRPLPNWRMDGDSVAAAEANEYEDGNAETRTVEPFAGVIRGYQDVFYLRGTMVGGILLIGLAGLVPLWRRLGGRAFLPWTLATGLLLAPAATAEFDYRYVLPAVPLAALAAGMAFTPEVRQAVRGGGRRLRRLGPGGTAAPVPAPGERVEEKVPEVAAR
ncbi:hypothetical protein [Actinomadura sp. WAC 06369]|uniref:hypothetical protein n=1 Tax=Actinomadura sp. WAC 06369 TaxID=2203193 RepID=UPI001F2869BA|nr:hypothetical protein [Actinomadura sp. WAC 06369]